MRKHKQLCLKSGCTLQVCLAFESMDVGKHMLTWATKFCLFPDDEVYIVHCLSKVRASIPDPSMPLSLKSAALDSASVQC